MSSRYALFAVTFAALIAGCGGDDSSGGGKGGSGSSSSESHECCRNGEYYDCSSESAANACFDSGDTSGCSHTKSDPNGECN